MAGLVNDMKVKSLPHDVVETLKLQNKARLDNGLPPVVVKVRRCLACGYPFESLGNRTCGCSRSS